MNTLRYSRTMSLEDIISTTPELQDFISSLGLVPKKKRTEKLLQRLP